MTPKLLAAARSWDTATLKRRVEDARENVRYATQQRFQYNSKQNRERLTIAQRTLDALAAILREREEKKQMPTWEKYDPESEDMAPIENWGSDHWSTFAYLETCAVDNKGVINNNRMRCNPRLHRGFANIMHGEIVDGSEYPTRLKDGVMKKHDDWSCIEDMVVAGLVTAFWRVKKHGEAFGCNEGRIELTPLGFTVAGELRAYKASGGNYKNFTPSICTPPAPDAHLEAQYEARNGGEVE